MENFEPGSIWPAEDLESQLTREVYARFGLAMYCAQVLEHGLANFLMILKFRPEATSAKNQQEWETLVEQFYNTQFAKTLGNLLRAVEEINHLPDELVQELRQVKANRDYLAHRFFREHSESFLSQDGKQRMIIICEEFIQQIQKLDRSIEAIAEPVRTRQGLTNEMIDQEIQKIIKKTTEDPSKSDL